MSDSIPKEPQCKCDPDAWGEIQPPEICPAFKPDPNVSQCCSECGHDEACHERK